ncbi:MAG: prephenate dehydrogenase [Clostridiaceae bacterium]|jgi:prephenate dehydrogenase|nr:prephenate dehydrogenase [Clostridiaceae bacterium]
MKKIGVIGLGIIGGSLVKAIHKKGLADWIVAYNRDCHVTETALREGTIQQVALEIDDSFVGCEIIFICVPVDKIPAITYKLGGIVHKDCILTDVGSTKDDVIGAVHRMSLDCPFIGGHPMAGSEATGYKAARANLFENAYYILTPLQETDEKHVNKLSCFVRSFGALPIVMKPDRHDYATAAISHVPHVLASALVNTIHRLDGEDKIMHTLAAGGFKDITRIASSSPDIWESICRTNKGNIIEVLDELVMSIQSFKNTLSCAGGEMKRFFYEAKQYRDSFLDNRVGAIVKTYDIVVDVEDKPGVIAAIASILGENNISIKNIGINNSREMEGGAMEICFYDHDSQTMSLGILKEKGYTVSIKG